MRVVVDASGNSYFHFQTESKLAVVFKKSPGTSIKESFSSIIEEETGIKMNADILRTWKEKK